MTQAHHWLKQRLQHDNALLRTPLMKSPRASTHLTDSLPQDDSLALPANRFTESFRSAGTSGGDELQPSTQARPARAGCPGPWPLGFAVSPRMETPPPLPLLHQPHAETAWPPLPVEFHVFSLVPTASCPATHRKALGPALQPLCSPPHCPLTQPVLSQLVYERAMGDSDKGFIQVRLNNNSHCSPLLQHPVASTWKTRRSLKHHFPLVNPRRPLPITFLAFLGLAVLSRRISSITFPGNESRLTSPYSPRSSILSFFKIQGLRALFHSSGTAPRHHDLAKIMERGLPRTSGSSLGIPGCNPSGAVDIRTPRRTALLPTCLHLPQQQALLA